MSFDVVVRVWERNPHSFVNTYQRKYTNRWYTNPYMISCDTCDSKNTKTPVLCVYARTRESRWLHVFLQFNFSLSLFLLATTRKRHVVLEKTIRCFVENDTLFYGKRHVVLDETIRCFRWNDTLFYEKQAVILPETFNAAFFSLSSTVKNLHYLCTSIRPRGLAISHNL